MTPTPTSGAADLPEALTEYLEAQDALDNREYAGINAEPYEKLVRSRNNARAALESALAAGQATAAQQGAYAALPEKYYLAGGEVPTWDAKQIHAFADATHALRVESLAAAYCEELDKLSQRNYELRLASHGQAPASVLHLVHSAFAEIAMAFPKAFALHKVGIADTAVREALAAPALGAVAGPTSMPPSAFLNAAGIKADDMPGAVVRKLDASFHEAVTFADAAPTPAAQADSQPAPIDMVLHCPACGLQHIDAPDAWRPGSDPLWDNPPHRSHLCHGCGHIWRPADVPTNGMEAVKTRGKADSPIAARAQADSVLYDPKAVLEIFNSARAGSDKPLGYLRGILAVIAHWESRPEPHRWMVPVQADSVQEDAARLDFLIDQGAYVVSAPDTCTGHWLHWARPDGSTWVQGDEHPTPRAAIDAARKQGATQ